MKSIRLFLLFFMFFLKLSFVEGEQVKDFDVDDYSNTIDFQASPSSVVGGAVNVITGRYFENNNASIFNFIFQ